MLKNKFVTAVAALALAAPLAIASPTFAQPAGHGGHGGGHGGGHAGAHFGGGHMGGARMGGARMGAAARVNAGPRVSAAQIGGARISGSRHMAGGNWHGDGRHGWRGGHRHGGGFFPGLIAGSVIGGAWASGPYYDDDDYGYYDDGPSVEVVPGGGDDVAYCQQRYKSYDVNSGTYLGYDGLRHPCP